MSHIGADEFWPRYRDAVRARGSLNALSNTREWTRVAVEAAKSVCTNAGLITGNELYLDVMAYEQRTAGVFYDWHLRVAFEHENGRNWHDELCKLCHVVADLRVLVGYFIIGERIDDVLQRRIDSMGERLTRVAGSDWLFIFGPDDSRRDARPWVAFTLDGNRRLAALLDDNPFNPFHEYSRSK